MNEVLRGESRVVEFPTSDGRPVAETPLHYKRLSDLAYCLTTFFRRRADAYVGVNMLAYDDPKEPGRHLSPDIFVAFGGLSEEEREREIYKLWEEPSPAFVLEVTSRSTRREDERKKVRYAKWGVAEYFMYDPRGEYLVPALQGYELSRRGYRSMPERTLSNGERGLSSGRLGLDLWLDGSTLRLYDPVAGRNLLTPEETEQRRLAAEARARTAEMELSDLKARIGAASPPKEGG